MEQPPTAHEAAPPEGVTAASPAAGPINIDQAPKPRGHQRLLKSLQRMSSSPSLARMASRASAASAATPAYNVGSAATLSCISLASPVSASSSYGHSYGSSYSSQLSAQSSAGFSTAPTSVASTPGAEMPLFDFKSRFRSHHHHPQPLPQHARHVSLDCKSSSPLPATTAPLPPHVQFSSMSAALASAPVLSDKCPDYFSAQPLPQVAKKPQQPRRPNFSLWKELPPELRVEVLRWLTPKEIIRSSAVSKEWHATCFDGQLWASLDATGFYQEIPGETLVKIMTSAGPFIKDLNLRGCAQMYERWANHSQKITEACRNIEHFSLDGCKIDRTSVHYFLLRNPSLIHVNLSACGVLSNSAMKILGQNCPNLETLNVSWCAHVDTKGLQRVVQGCPRLKDLRASEIRGWDDEDFLLDLYERNSLERLLISNCADFDNASLALLIHGKDPPVDLLTGRAVVPPRAFRHLDFHRCRQLANSSVQLVAHNTPRLTGLRLSQCTGLGDDAVVPIVETCPQLTHLDLEELDLTNAALQALARSPCAAHLRHLNISYCEALGDPGMLPVVKACGALRSLEMDNTRVSDLVLVEVAAQVRARNRAAPAGNASGRPELGMSVVAYDCSNVTWTGVREVLSRNAEFYRRPPASLAPAYPREAISLKCFYGYQQTVREHTKRVLRGELARATLLERKWAEYMLATEEAGMTGSGMRRRRRRAREAERVHADEQDDPLGRGTRRRARSGGCVVM